MEENAKLDKALVLYMHKRTNYQCRDCLLAKDHANKCALYGPAISIKPIGGCNLWIMRKGAVFIPFLGGYTKEGTGYVENADGFTCGRCEEFLPEENACKKVNKNSPGDDPGQILSVACCNRWEKLGADE